MEYKNTEEYVEPMSLVDIVFLVWRSRWLVFGITAVVVCLAAAYVLVAKDRYRSDILMKPMDSTSGQGLSNQANGLGGLASLAGLSVGANPSAEPLAVLTSREFTGAFIEEQHLLPVLYPKMWDTSAGTWKSNIVNPPDIRDGIQYFSKTIRNVQEDRKTGLVTMTIEWRDPVLAADWANLLVEKVNAHMRQRALTEAESNVNFLKGELAAATLVPLQQSISRVLENELQKLMLAKANKEFAFRVIDHAVVSKLPSRPQRLLILAGGFLGGISTSLVAILFIQILRRQPKVPDLPTRVV